MHFLDTVQEVRQFLYKDKKQKVSYDRHVLRKTSCTQRAEGDNLEIHKRQQIKGKTTTATD